MCTYSRDSNVGSEADHNKMILPEHVFHSKLLHYLYYVSLVILVIRTQKSESEALWSQLAHRAGAYPGFRSMKRLGVFLLLLDGMLVHRRSLPSNLLGFPNISPVPIYTPGWREAL